MGICESFNGRCCKTTKTKSKFKQNPLFSKWYMFDLKENVLKRPKYICFEGGGVKGIAYVG